MGKGKLLSELAGKLARPPLDPSVSLAAINARQQAAEAANRAGVADAYYARVRNLVRSKMNYPDDDPGNPVVEFRVTLLPDMAVLNVEMKKSSGNAAFDEAVKRALMRIEQYPPLPAGMEFSGSIRNHILKYRLHEQ
ncbi:TonB C-terminal domain-containing protein [Chitinimonas arctica]|uniref:TonB C-terminal domain-containing protein n=1 Tax=Chitinimonas arctica TaxID=2594795 RepID=A0A516SFP0_9NEIS|nr:TonB C-terminal domain-containing protein [Chitinimonas arctica]